MSLKVSISGPAGSGKSTVMSALADIFDAEVADVGQIFRKRAQDAGMTIDEYDAYLESHPGEDEKMDEDFRDLIRGSEKNIIVSWRVGFHFVPELTSIWLDVDPDEGARRVYGDDRSSEVDYDTLDEVKVANLKRMEDKRQQLQKLYGVDFMDTSNYSLVYDTTGKSPDEVVSDLKAYLEDQLS